MSEQIEPTVEITPVTKEPEVEQIAQQNLEENFNEVSEFADNKQFNKIIRQIIANGGRKIANLRIKNVNITVKDTYTMVSFTLAAKIRGMVSDDNGSTFNEGMTNVLYTSTYSLAGMLKENEKYAWIANYVLLKPNIINLIFNGGSIDILQQDYAAGEEIDNPFSTKENSESVIASHDTIINRIIGIKLGVTGEQMADKLANNILGNFNI